MIDENKRQKKKQALDYTYAELLSNESIQKQECFRAGIFIWVSVGLLSSLTIWALL